MRPFRKFLERSALSYAFQVAIASLISYFIGEKIGSFISKNDTIGALWCVLSAVFALQPKHTETYKASLMRLLGSFIGSATSAVFLSLMGPEVWSIILCLFFTTILCSVFRLTTYLQTANFAVIVIMVVSQITGEENPWLFCLLRFVDSAMGIIVAIAILHIFHPKRDRRRS